MLRIKFWPHLLIVQLAFLIIQACTPQTAPTIFRPPTQPQPTQILATTTPIPVLFTPIPTITITPTESGPCTNNLDFIQDITIPDDTIVASGASMDKQWLVANSGTCNWDSTYRLKLVGGNSLGAAQEQTLYPARAGTQATLHLIFTAPVDGGTYESSWQAFGSDGIAFGDPIYMRIVVLSP